MYHFKIRAMDDEVQIEYSIKSSNAKPSGPYFMKNHGCKRITEAAIYIVQTATDEWGLDGYDIHVVDYRTNR
jgi:hypothetical protein